MSNFYQSHFQRIASAVIARQTRKQIPSIVANQAYESILQNLLVPVAERHEVRIPCGVVFGKGAFKVDSKSRILSSSVQYTRSVEDEHVTGHKILRI